MKAKDNTEERKRKKRERTQRYRKNRMERMTEGERIEFWKKESQFKILSHGQPPLELGLE